MKMISNFLWSVEWIFFTDLIPYIFWYFYTEIFTIKNCFAVIFRAIFVLSNKSTLLILLRMYALRLKKSKLFGQRIKNSLRACLSSAQQDSAWLSSTQLSHRINISLNWGCRRGWARFGTSKIFIVPKV